MAEEADLISGAEIVGYYSMNRVKTYLPNSSRLTYYKPPQHEDVYFDLNSGIESTIRRDYSSGDGRLLFKWIERNYKSIEASPETGRWLEPNFVCTSALLQMLLNAKSSQRNWSIYAAKRRGNIYLCFGPRKFSGYYHNPEDDLLSSWLYKFERYVVSDHADEAPNPSNVVVEPDVFKCVYKARFGEHSILYDAPKKAVRSDIQLSDPLPLGNLNFTLLRLEKLIDRNAENSLVRHKLNKWWSIGYLTNTEEVLCGFRNAGIVTKVKIYSLREIVQEAKLYFNPAACVNYCKSILSTIAETMVDDETIFEFEQTRDRRELIIKEIRTDMFYTVIPPYFQIPEPEVQ